MKLYVFSNGSCDIRITTQGLAWGKEHLRQFGAIDSQLDSHLTAKIDDNLQTSASVLGKVRATRWLGKWSLEKKREQFQLGLA